MSFLIVDDAPESRLLLQSLLESAGYADVRAASSAQAALDYLQIDRATSAPPSVALILMDLMMPGLDGIVACRRIKADARFADVPIIMVTAVDEARSLDAAFQAGATDYLTKPVERIELLARIRSALRLKAEREARLAREQELAKRNQELEQALKEVKTLRGLIPICASCKKIRNEQGFWQQVESYIQERSDALFSHGVCTECLNKHYPGLGGR
jgi:CheY-like chemotaxis protein